MASGGGLLVTLDGPSGVGKTTVSGLVRDCLALAGVPVVLTTIPSSSSLGELARHGTNQFFGMTLTCLVAADRYHHDQTTVRNALERGSVVVCDRYVPSSLVLDILDGVERDHVWSMHGGQVIGTWAWDASKMAVTCSIVYGYGSPELSKETRRQARKLTETLRLRWV